MLTLGLLKKRRNTDRIRPSRTRYSGLASQMRGSRHSPVDKRYTEKERANGFSRGYRNEQSSYERMGGSGAKLGNGGVGGDASSQRRLKDEYQPNAPPTVIR